MNKPKIDFLDFVKKFNKKEKDRDHTYYAIDFLGIYDIDKNEHGHYYIRSLDDFSVVCELPVWLNQFFLQIENQGISKVQKQVRAALGIN